MPEIKIGKKNIGGENPVYIIAEAGSNFDGDLGRAKYLAKLAKEVGADAYKIQNFSAPKMLSKKGFENFQVSYQSKWDDSVFEVYRRAEFPRKWLKELSDYCRKIGIDFFSSPYDIAAGSLLEKIGVSAYKIGSGEIDNLEFLEYVARLGKPIIFACGTATLEEIGSAVSVIRDSGNNKIVLLKCVTNYPSPIADANIRAMVAIKEKFRVEVGYSDHTIGEEGGGDDPLHGITVPLGAVALGASVIEKHFTDDRTRKGPDHPFAMGIEEFREMVKGIRSLEKSLGNGIKRVMPSEKETAFIMRRSIYAKKNIEKGQKISRDGIEFLRPAIGLRPPQINEILDKTAKRKILAGEPITLDDVG
jgi:N-acetylneuraminate synthase